MITFRHIQSPFLRWMLALGLAALSATSARPAAPPPWPAELAPALEFTPRTESAATPDGWVYTTPHFRFHCDAELAPGLIKHYALVFEGTFHAVRKLPLQLCPDPPQDRFVVRLMKNREDYLRAGGPKGSAGVYLLNSREILVPADSPGVRTIGKRIAIDRKSSDTGTLVHEITHQVMHDWLNALPVWFAEGFAEYMAAVPCEQGRFRFRAIHEGIRRHLQEEHLVPKDDQGALLADLAPPDQILNLTHAQWSAALTGEEDASLNYRSAMMLVYFFIHLDGSDDGQALAAYLQGTRSGREDMRSFVASYNEAVADYNAGLEAYNHAVTAYNQALLRFRQTVQAYNSRVRTYNSQLAKGASEDELIPVGPEPSPPPSPPVEPEMPAILAGHHIPGGAVDLSEAEKKARAILTRNRSPEALWNQMAAALEAKGILIRHADAMSGDAATGAGSQ